MNIGASSTYVSKASSNKGMSGLASGMDTDAMVEAMLANTQAKIDKQNALKNQTEWKQEIYRELITQINSFQNKFFNSSSPTSLMNQAFFNAMSAVSKSNAIKVNATSSAAAGNTKIEVRQLASNASVTSSKGVSGKLAGEIDAAKIDELIKGQLDGDYKLAVSVGEKDINVDLKEIFVENGKFTSTTNQQKADAIVEKLNAAFEKAGVDVTAKYETGALTLTGSDPETPIIIDGESGAQALGVLGMTAGMGSQPTAGRVSTQLISKTDFTPSYKLKVTLDDQEKEIKIDMREILDANGKTDAGLVRAELGKKLDAAFGVGQVKVEAIGANGFELKVSTGRKVMIGGDKAVLDSMGVKNGQSNRIGLGGRLDDLFFNEPLQGSTFRFSINGEDFSFNNEDTIGDIINAVNTSDAGVRIVYKAQDDKFIIQTNDSGEGREIKMEQTEGNLLTSLFGEASGTSVGSRQLGVNTIVGGNEYYSGIKGGTFDLVVDGVGYSIAVPTKEGVYGSKELLDAVNAELEKEFGANQIKLVDNGNGTTLEVNNGSIVNIAKTGLLEGETYGELAKNGNLAVAFGFGEKGADNIADGDATLGELGLDSLGAPGTKLSDIHTVNPNLAYRDGRIILTGNGAAVSVGDAATMEKLFGSQTVSLGQGSGTQGAEYKEGQNAIVSIDGLVTERSSNNFSVNGLNFDLLETTGSFVKGGFAGGEFRDADGNLAAGAVGVRDGELLDAAGTVIGRGSYIGGKFLDADGNEVTNAQSIKGGDLIDKEGNTLFKGESATVETTRNTDSIVEGVKGFIDEYNKLIKTVNEYLDEDANYKKYPPLTEAQKKEMSEKEIELWEKKAKEGLLRNDSALSGFLQSMRTTIYSKPAGSNIAIYNLGIDTGSWDSKGQLVLSTDGEAQLRRMIESDSSAVLKLFTDPEEGLGVKLNNILDATAKTSSGDPGSLVSLAGVKGMASATQNTLYSQLKSIDQRISTLKNTYEKEKARYWRQFNSMEQVISNMNAQSSWLSQQLSF